MSRIGKKPITIPSGVQVSIAGNVVSVTGPKGTLSRLVHDEIRAKMQDNALSLIPALQTKRTAALWGLERALLANIVQGVSTGYEKRLEIDGVGYRVVSPND